MIARLETARTPWTRLIGLLGRTTLPPGHGLLLDPCPSIHTFGMLFPIDAIFLDNENRITRIHRNIGPFRIVFGGRKATRVIEVQSGWLPKDAIAISDHLAFCRMSSSPSPS
ncbi:MAG: hypothetical protein A2X46_14910 [Lentisphaerae bacterium GWF2_57_35]|nr:MAG: hypothetical protein A2X46_14910 [Lentisphaerae bacterium GWF2_57_35]